MLPLELALVTIVGVLALLIAISGPIPLDLFLPWVLSSDELHCDGD